MKYLLGYITTEQFLKEYWQKKPLLIRNAWPGFKPLLSAEELAGLSLEDAIETRIVQEKGESPWQVRTGPFTEKDYQKLPDSHWTLLVQAVDQWIPEAADLLEHFRFIPSWRIDDLMISYATDQGGVGPHYDQYDVFLLQAEGQREWRIGQMCDDDEAIVQGPKIRLLENFEESERWVLNPGDMLYLPPRLAHWGIAQGECMTYSIGFRAPSLAELTLATGNDLLASLGEDSRYEDGELEYQEETGLISSKAVTQLRKQLLEVIGDEQRLYRVLGSLMTEAKYQEMMPETLEEANWEKLIDLLEEFDGWRRAEFARFAYHLDSTNCYFYALGMSRPLSLASTELVKYLANQNTYSAKKLLELAANDEQQELLLQLWKRQAFYCPALEED